MKIPWIVALLLSSMVAFAPLHAAQAPKLETLLAEYHKARADVLSKLNEAYASQADFLVKPYLEAANLDGADRARSFAKRLRDADQRNDILGPATGTAPNDAVAALEANYALSREENLRNVYVFYASTAKNLQQKLSQSHDTAGAAVLTTFLEKIKPESSPLSAPVAVARSRNLLDKAFEQKWKTEKGEWRTENGVLVGSGDSGRAFMEAIAPPFTLQFKITVLDAARPSVRLGPVTFGSESTKPIFGLYPEPGAAKAFAYKRKKGYAVSIVADQKSVELFIDGKSVMAGHGLKERIDKLVFSAGDATSKGRVEYRDIVLIK